MKTEDLVVMAVVAAAALAGIALKYLIDLMTREAQMQVPSGAKGAAVTPEERNRMLAEHAYQLAVERGFANGDPVQDWVEAKRAVDAQLEKTGLGKTGLAKPRSQHPLISVSGQVLTRPS